MPAPFFCSQFTDCIMKPFTHCIVFLCCLSGTVICCAAGQSTLSVDGTNKIYSKVDDEGKQLLKEYLAVYPKIKSLGLDKFKSYFFISFFYNFGKVFFSMVEAEFRFL
jgi:hypothetical protein